MGRPASTASFRRVLPLALVAVVLAILFGTGTHVRSRTVLDFQFGIPGCDPTWDRDTLLLQLPDTGGLEWNGMALSPQALGAALSEKYRDFPDKIVFMDVGGHRTYGEFIAAMDIARAAGVMTFVLLAPEPRHPCVPAVLFDVD